jgi:hypothetical protein
MLDDADELLSDREAIVLIIIATFSGAIGFIAITLVLLHIMG